MHIKKQTINEHFGNKKAGTGRERFIKQTRDEIYAEAWFQK